MEFAGKAYESVTRVLRSRRRSDPQEAAPSPVDSSKTAYLIEHQRESLLVMLRTAARAPAAARLCYSHYKRRKDCYFRWSQLPTRTKHEMPKRIYCADFSEAFLACVKEATPRLATPIVVHSDEDKLGTATALEGLTPLDWLREKLSWRRRFNSERSKTRPGEYF